MTGESMEITLLDLENKVMVEQCARVLVQAFKVHHPLAWPTLALAREELEVFASEDRIGLTTVTEDSQVLGWIGAIRQYHGHSWELHPLAVDPVKQRQGVGHLLVNTLEQRLYETKASTLYLMTDDENNQTTLADVALYPEPLEQLMQIVNINQHPFEFYLKQGFCVSGVIPDANGPGKPDILMSKSIARPTSPEIIGLQAH
jgi:aminoglycoside 6'-N-acetyltransferase I